MAVVKVAASTGKRDFAGRLSPPPPPATRPSPDGGRCFPAPRRSCRSGARTPAPRPPSTMELIVPPPALSARNAASAESGIDSITATVARMLPRKIRIISAVSTRPMPPSLPRFLIAVFTKTDWSKTTLRHERLGNIEQVCYARLDAVHDGDGVAVAALLQDRQVDGFLAIDAHDVGLDLLRVLRMAHVARPCTEPLPTVFSGRRLISSVVGSWLLV